MFTVSKRRKKEHCVCHYFFLFIGMVTIKAPNTKVCYQSSPVVQCLFEESTDSAQWTMTNKTNSFELNNGSVVQLNHNCATNRYRSCTAVTLRRVLGNWEGRNKSLPVFGAEILMTSMRVHSMSNKHLNINMTIFIFNFYHYGDHIGWWLFQATDIRQSESYSIQLEFMSTIPSIILPA